MPFTTFFKDNMAFGVLLALIWDWALEFASSKSFKAFTFCDVSSSFLFFRRKIPHLDIFYFFCLEMWYVLTAFSPKNVETVSSTDDAAAVEDITGLLSNS